MVASLKSWTAVFAVWVLTLLIRVRRTVVAWRWWVKTGLWLLVISIVAYATATAEIFTINRPALVGIIGFQAGIAAYLLSVSRHDHADRLEANLRAALNLWFTDNQDAQEFLDTVIQWTLRAPQVYAVHVLLIDIVLTPAVLLRSMYVQNWIVVALLWCMSLLVWSTMILRVDMFAPVVSRWHKRFEAFLATLTVRELTFIGSAVVIFLLFFASMSPFVTAAKHVSKAEPPSEQSNPDESSNPTSDSERPQSGR